MKQLVCEMCNSNDLVKQDGLFVCQHCGTKYTVEEARKMMVEGTVDVSGSTVKVDETDRTTNLYKLARQAKVEGNIGQAAQYYNELALLQPDDWESSFYSAYYQALSCKVAQIPQSIATITNRANSTLSLIKTSYSPEKCKPYVVEIANAVSKAFDILDANVKQYKSKATSSTMNTAISWENACIDMLLNMSRAVMVKFHYKDLALELCKKALRKCQFRKKTDVYSVTKEIDPNFDIEAYLSSVRQSVSQSTGGGCYVATAVYGSYDCPQVWTLRRFRDETLAATWYGRAFIHTYYAISPTLVKWFGHTEWFKSMWKGKLDRMVAKLNMSGVEDTPYEDRVW